MDVTDEVEGDFAVLSRAGGHPQVGMTRIEHRARHSFPIVLVALAVLFIGMVDNFVRPLFIQGQAGMHTLLVFFSIMGGIAYFGMIGMVFGPIIVSLGLTFLELYRIEFKEELVKPQ